MITRLPVSTATCLLTVACLAVVALLQRRIEAGSEPARVASDKPRLRQPVAIALADQGATLLVANGRSGSLSVVDLSSGKCSAEFDVGTRLVDLAVLPTQTDILVVDEARHELIGVSLDADGVKVRARLAVSDFPISLVVSPDGRRCCIASLWSRSLSVVDVATPASDADAVSLHVAREVLLPFAPRQQLLLPGGTRLLVADAFGGRLAVVDLDEGVVESVREIPAHNIRGLGISRDGRYVLMAQQTLNPLARTEADDIHWGLLVAGSVRVLTVDALLDAKADILNKSWSIRLGDVGRGAGDPAGLVVLDKERVLVAAGGTGEVLCVNLRGTIRRVHVGRRPAALLPSAGGEWVYVADTFADSVSVIDPERMQVVREIPLGPMRELSSAERGERLFYDARLSHGGWFSCHSCHTDGHSNDLRADTLGDGSYGDPKRILPLGGVSETGPWAWNGQVTRLEEQIDKSIRTTMRGRTPAADETADLVAFLEMLSPPPPLPERRLNRDAVVRGQALFDELRCNQCHVPPTYTSPDVFDVGLPDESGRRRFNPPSLRGAGQRGGYFHDGRSTSLRDVVSTQKHQLSRELSEQERFDLVEFLRSL